MAWFEWPSSREKKSAVKNIVALMKADGKVTESEMACLKAVCQRVELSEEELQKIMDAPDATRFVVPRKTREKVQQLVEIAAMMLADGETDEREGAIFYSVAKAFGFERSVAEELNERIVESLVNKEPIDHVCDKIERFLEFP